MSSRSSSRSTARSSRSTATTDDSEVLDAVKDDPVLQGHSALTDPDLGGSTAASWTGTGGPDPGGVATPAAPARQDTDGASAASGVGQAASALADQGQQAMGQVVDQAQQVAGQAVTTAKEQTTSRLNDQKDQLATTISAVAEAIRTSSQGLRDQNQAAVAGYADQAAGRLDAAAGYLHQHGVAEMIEEVEAFARRNPPLFLGAAFGLGALAARFLKSSRQQQAGGASSGSQRGGSGAYQDSSSGTDQGTGAYARDVTSGVS